MDFDVAVVGAGCIGASTAKHLAEAGHSVVVLEKEAEPAMHQSGRNSGVIHAGYNLKPGSVKAEYCVEGSRRMRAYCLENGVPMDQGGILVVATQEDRIPVVEEIHRRGKANGVEVRLLDEAGIREVEPHGAGITALHAPEGASVDPGAYVRALVADAVQAGAEFRYGVAVKDIRDPRKIKAGKGRIKARAVVNAAGLHADRLAGSLGSDLRVLPFRGYYAQLVPDARKYVRSHLYAAPDPAFPFLGVHLSKRTDGRVTAGPGAMLAFGREKYTFTGTNARDLAGTLAWPGFWKMLGTRDFRRQARTEVAKSLRLKSVWKEARALVPALRPEDLMHGGPDLAGNRAQLVDRQGNLVDDILVRETGDAVHVLNAVSPGMTCSLPFGEDLARRAAAKL